MRILDFNGDESGSSLDVPTSIYSSSRLVLGRGGRCGMLNSAKTCNTTRMNIDRPIIAFFKENFFLPDFSRTCTAKAKVDMLKKH